MIRSAARENPLGVVLALVLFSVVAIALAGLFVVNPNEAKVLTLFGRYVGSVKVTGLWWVNPFMVKKKVSLRVRNFETSKLKVNDSHSNPIEIAAVVVWKRRILELDGERRAAMVSNLLVVLCSERGTTPVVNAGTLYQ